MSPLVDRGTAGEYGNHVLIYRLKWLDPFPEGIKELQQGPSPILSIPCPIHKEFPSQSIHTDVTRARGIIRGYDIPLDDKACENFTRDQRNIGSAERP